MNLRSLPIGARLALGFAVVLALLAAVLVGGNIATEITTRELTQGLARGTAKSAAADGMQIALLEGAMATRNIGLQADVAGTQAEEAKVKEQRKRYLQARERFTALGVDDAEKEILATIDRLDREVEKPLLEAVGQSLLFNNEVAAKVITTRIDPLHRKSLDEIQKLVDMEQVATRELLARTAESARRMNVLLYLLGALAIAIGVVSSVLITRSITLPLRGAVAIARRVAAGDLSTEVRASSRDETGQLLQALSEMTISLRTLVGEVAEGARTVAQTSAQIAQGNLDLSQRTEEQAGTLEETASSMEELTATVTQNAENARAASELAVDASRVATRGGGVVGEVVSTMTGISESSRRISDIIAVIDGIAFQTNILALNAAVEAARAGEQGRGFAVVAAEVRNLAQRSASAAKEIKGLIVDSVDKVDAGSRLVDAAGRTMEEIVASVKKVSDLVGEIAAASREQSAGIGQVNTAITQMEQVVQQNASLVEEAAASTESMKEQAAGLLQMVSRFKLASGDEAPASPAAPLAVRRSAPIQPIRVRSSVAKAPAVKLASSGGQRHAAGASAAGWNEF
ncbi:MAG TPA: methyl-accepting chemotaxis protein [Ramlibacter sp.]|jgi:methyl-accepting chemotaxis protein|nr:methyl-accepting chemotaxis protein [Ramlibacter sp.]